MVLHDLSRNNSELSRFVAEIRDIHIQKDRLRFRRNLERIGEVMAYEISKTFTYSTKEIQTPLGISPANTSDNPIVIADHGLELGPARLQSTDVYGVIKRAVLG